jgi:hypothetical protein
LLLFLSFQLAPHSLSHCLFSLKSKWNN